MAQSLEQQLQSLETALIEHSKNNSMNDAVTDALKAQIATVRKKINNKAGRKATLLDGTVVGVGDTVYTCEPTRVFEHDRVSGKTICPGKIEVRVITAINPAGDELAYDVLRNGYTRHMLYSVNRFYGSEATARVGMVVKAQREVNGAEGKLKEATAALHRAQVALNLTQQDDFGAATAAMEVEAHRQSVERERHRQSVEREQARKVSA